MQDYILYLGWFMALLLLGYIFIRWKHGAINNVNYEVLKKDHQRLETEKSELISKNEDLRDHLEQVKNNFIKEQAEKEGLEKRLKEQQEYLESLKLQLSDSFKALASDALSSNTEAFLKLASERLDKKNVEAKHSFNEKLVEFSQVVKPIQETLKKVEEDIQSVEKTRIDQFSRISEQMLNVAQSSETLRKEANSLVSALKRPEVRGSWGELQLKRVVELSGMSPHCDFDEQVSVSKDGGIARPDMVVRLPNNRTIVVDSKASMDSFLEATEAQNDELKKQALTKHAKNIRNRVQELAKKSYWEQFENTPEFTVLFIPNEALLMAAVEIDKGIIEDSLKEKIVIATPTTLVALLKAVAYGWQQNQMADNAQKIILAAKELQERLGPWMKHLQTLGNHIEGVVKSFNSTVGSLESRVLPSAKKFQSLGVKTHEALESKTPYVDKVVRELSTREPGDLES